MTTRADVVRLSSASRAIVDMAKEDLADFIAGLDFTRPEVVRDALLEVVPVLVREYGDVAAVAAAEWYEETRAAQVPGRFVAVPAAAVDPAQVEATVRWAAGGLFTEDAAGVLARLEGAMQRYITYSARETVRGSVAADPARPRFARVPSGPKTCAWCTMLASRGFVYRSEESAGDLGRGFGEDFHDDCDCQVVPEWDAAAHHIDGYDPDQLYDLYQKARKEAGSGDLTEITAAARRLEPDRFTDGVHTD